MKILTIILVIFIALVGCRSQEKSLVDQIKSAGLEIENVQILQAHEVPPGSSGGHKFKLPSHCEDCGGKILIFDREADAEKMAQVWRQMGQYVYVKNGILLQISARIDERVANEYGNILIGVEQ